MTLESGHHEVTVFGAKSTVRSPLKLVREMVRDAMKSRELASMLAYRDLKAQYRQSILGWFWLIIPPIAWTVGMTVLRKNNLADLGDTPLYYPAYVLINMSMWQMFTSALKGPMQAFQQNRGILTKVRFPREAIIVADIMKLWVEVVVYMLLIVGAFVFYKIPVTWTALLFPAAYLVLVLLGTTIGLFLAPIGLLYRDIGNLLPYVTMAGLTITPILFAMPGPENDGLWAAVVRLNPVSSVIVTARELACGEPLTMLPGFFLVTALTAVGFLLGLTYLRASTPLIVERWSS